MSRRSVTAALIATVVLLIALSFALAPGAPQGAEGFTGADTQAMQYIEQSRPDYEPWFTLGFPALPSQVESGLFALQAALGGIALGYAVGRLRGRRAT